MDILAKNNRTSRLGNEEFENVRCATCKEYLNCPPLMTYFGKNSYTECGRCFNAEATAKQSLTAVRNKCLELLASLVPYPCKYFKYGCQERHTWPKIDAHQLECIHRPFECPHQNQTCLYVGTQEALLEHYSKKHSGLIILNGSFLEAFDRNFENCYLIKQNNDLFILQIKYDEIASKAWLKVASLAGKNELNFTIEFTSENIPYSFYTVKGKTFNLSTNETGRNKSFEVDIGMLKKLYKWPEHFVCKVFLDNKTLYVIENDWFKEIQCPACWDYLIGKIYVCNNCHNVCERCKKFASNCPLCKEIILDVRNYSLEKVVSFAHFPCKNRSHGCSYSAHLNEVIYHHNFCSWETLK